ncbi:MAG: chemotaxis protein CheB [Anaerolineales bacterium]|nr:chemotaxis protein CheB [Anaerolineales bacterium]
MAYTLVVIGSSKGGLRALQTILRALPAAFSLPVVIAQHREKGADETLAALLQQHSLLPVYEAEDKTPLLPGHIYLAPPDYHLLIESQLPAPPNHPTT